MFNRKFCDIRIFLSAIKPRRLFRFGFTSLFFIMALNAGVAGVAILSITSQMEYQRKVEQMIRTVGQVSLTVHHYTQHLRREDAAQVNALVESLREQLRQVQKRFAEELDTAGINASLDRFSKDYSEFVTIAAQADDLESRSINLGRKLLATMNATRAGSLGQSGSSALNSIISQVLDAQWEAQEAQSRKAHASPEKLRRIIADLIAYGEQARLKRMDSAAQYSFNQIVSDSRDYAAALERHVTYETLALETELKLLTIVDSIYRSCISMENQIRSSISRRILSVAAIMILIFVISFAAAGFIIAERKQIVRALEESNRKFEALSSTDGLTGIANRRRFDDVLEIEYGRHCRTGAELSVILLDVDHFKAFNDSYGHVAGDDCLKQIGKILAGCANRPADLSARYGGEEFACILPETDRNGAVVVAEKIRRSIVALAIPHKGSAAADCVTASLGVISVHCTPGQPANSILPRVDELLYRAKSNGRNRIEFSSAPTAVTSPDGIAGTIVKLVWHDSFNCGNPLIDGQHRQLFDLSNDLFRAVLSNRPPDETAVLIDRLLHDVGQHFQDEQLLLESTPFPFTAQHSAEHAALVSRGIELSQQFNAKALAAGDLFQFLAYDVVMVHMLGADREFFPYIHAAGSSQN